jgi:TfoX N-terminal domain
VAFNEVLAGRVRAALARKRGLEEKKLFGCVAFLLRGNVALGVWKDSLIVRLGPEQGEEALLEPHVRPFDITVRPMRGWVVVEAAGVAGDEELKGWVRRAVAFVGKLPPSDQPNGGER